LNSLHVLTGSAASGDIEDLPALRCLWRRGRVDSGQCPARIRWTI